MIPTEKLYQASLEFLEMDASPKDTAPDAFACAESLQQVYKFAFGEFIGGGNSTYWMWREMERQKNLFEKVETPTHGCIIISPTGLNPSDNPMRNGHCGIVGKHRVMSNDSRTGRWSQYFTVESWRAYYGEKGQYPIYFYKPLSIT